MLNNNLGKESEDVFLGHFLNGREMWSKGWTVQLIMQIKTCRSQCAHAVDRVCGYICADTSGKSEDAIATKFRQQDRIKNSGDCRTAVVYETVSAGASQSNPSSNATPFRKDNYDKFAQRNVECTVPS